MPAAQSATSSPRPTMPGRRRSLCLPCMRAAAFGSISILTLFLKKGPAVQAVQSVQNSMMIGISEIATCRPSPSKFVHEQRRSTRTRKKVKRRPPLSVNRQLVDRHFAKFRWRLYGRGAAAEGGRAGKDPPRA